MFEQYTERARRVIFFARYEASEFGSPVIDTDHLLLGLLREEKLLCFRWIPTAQRDTIRRAIEGWSEHLPKIPTSVDMPLSQASKHALEKARDEADRLNSRHIGTEHLLLGLLQEKCKASDLLFEMGADIPKLRARFEGDKGQQNEALAAQTSFMNRVRAEIQKRERFGATIELHGLRWNRDYILDGVKRCKKYNWHWRKASWKPRDIVVNRKTGKVSFDLGLAEDQANFELVKAGWKKDHCAICAWDLFESEDHHGIGYTNGQQWICVECYEKFWERPDFIAGAYSDLT